MSNVRKKPNDNKRNSLAAVEALPVGAGEAA